ncbi:helix-turn-helix domain-containing protein [Sedimentitalea sp. HM32M-2]|uniref:helix-turn-helix domain-containing protein n=1 Tax=Sedimentitalea sp. HM32M-2 TaxID=3351566 RepID=UPI00362A1160
MSKLAIAIDGWAAHNPFRTVARDHMANPSAQESAPLAEDRPLAASMRAVIAAMLHDGEPGIERLARAGETSVRSLQRQLAREGASFSEQLDIVRRKPLLSHIGSEDLSLAELSERLGYSEQSALARAVRRLTGRTPSQLIHERTA